jgi:hypothetical protein
MLGQEKWLARGSNFWMSLGDLWRPTDRVTVQGGARLEGNLFYGLPRPDPTISAISTTPLQIAPNTLNVSPRLGIAWSYGRESKIGSYGIRPRGTLRVGLGQFVAPLDVDLVRTPVATDGGSTSARQLFCLGPEAPSPDWLAYLGDPAAIPQRCNDAAQISAFPNQRPPLTVIARGFRAARAVRLNLGWSGETWRGTRTSLDVTRSIHVDQLSREDLNFSPHIASTLPLEAGRPLFVPLESIDSVTGTVDPREARRSADLSRVTTISSRGRSSSTQVALSLRPQGGLASSFSWSVDYVNLHVRDRINGFDGSTVSDPRRPEWSSGAGDIRHSLRASASWYATDNVWLAVTGMLRSGLLFTPLVQGDINGDGLFNDRPFVFAPKTSGDTALSRGMTLLLREAPSNIRQCLTTQLDRLARRNSCRAPLAGNVSGSIIFPGKVVGLAAASRVSFSFTNVLTGIDALVHGTAGMRGWGQQASPNPYLLVVRGFDPESQSFRYAVNPRFGDTRGSNGAFRSPFVMTVNVQIPIGKSQQEQVVDEVLRTRTPEQSGQLTTRSLRDRYRAMGGVVDPLPLIIGAKDSLLLTNEQTLKLTDVMKRYNADVDSAWASLVQFLEPTDGKVDRAVIRREVRAVRLWSYDLLIETARAVRALLTSEQLEFLAPEIQQYLNERVLLRLRNIEFEGS